MKTIHWGRRKKHKLKSWKKIEIICKILAELFDSSNWLNCCIMEKASPLSSGNAAYGRLRISTRPSTQTQTIFHDKTLNYFELFEAFKRNFVESKIWREWRNFEQWTDNNKIILPHLSYCIVKFLLEQIFQLFCHCVSSSKW